MNLKSVSDSQLLSDIKHYASEEKRNGIEVLHRLREIDSRKLFASLGFSSLFDYCTRELGYSEGSACRRISAMRLLRDLPEYEEKLKDGAVNVANLSKVQSFLKQVNYSKKEKLDLLKEVEGKSGRQTEQLLASILPEAARPEKERILNNEEVEIRFTADHALMEKLERIRNLLGHKLGDQKYSSLFEELADLALKKLDPEKQTTATVAVKRESTTRYIPAPTKRAVWQRDRGQCTYTDPKSQRRCQSRHGLQFEHITPFAQGGLTTYSNLKLLCPAHNQFSAIQAYGLAKMQRYWPK